MSKARDLANAGTALGAVTATELAYVDGVTSAIQTQIDSKIGSASAISPTIVDAKGDIIAATAADTVSKLTVGSNDTVLTADSSTATGLKWATPSALPSQTSKTGKFLSTNGTTSSWQSIDGSTFDWNYYLPAANPTGVSAGAPTAVQKVNGYWFILTGNGYISYSSDAKTWTRWASTATENVVQLNGVVYGNSTYVFYSDNGTVYSATSLGGTTTARTSQFSGETTTDAVYMAGSVNLFIIVGGGGKVSTSPDGITWTARTANQSTNVIYGIDVNDAGTLAILVSNASVANNASYSTDGTTWTTFSPDNNSASPRNGSITYDATQTKWIYTWNTNTWYESTNPTGGTWTQVVGSVVNYSFADSSQTNKYAMYGTRFLTIDSTNNKYIVMAPHANGYWGIYTFDPTISVTIHNGKLYKLDSVRIIFIPTGLGTNTYSAAPQISLGYNSGVFVAAGMGSSQSIISNA